MRLGTSLLVGAVAALGWLADGVLGQVQGLFTDSKTGITFFATSFDNSTTAGGFTFGYALPTVSGPSDEYVGIMIGSLYAGAGWSGVSHAGGMPNSLLLMAWPYNGEILTSFRYAGGYVTPDIYAGNATVMQISHTINSTHWTLIYRCQWCFSWNHLGAIGGQPTTNGFQLFGWSQAFVYPDQPSNPNSTIIQHTNGQGIYGVGPDAARNAQYSSWAALATPTPTSGTTGPTATAAYISKPVPSKKWDYVVIGAGAGGIVIADKLSESGKSVLLIERGPPSSYRWGGLRRPAWLNGSNLTRFDVPGLCNQIWVDSAGIACADIDQMAGCVLGGGTAVNSGLWWKPPARDWDWNFPAGWKATDMAPATARVFSRIPGTDHPSSDGKIYLDQGYNVISSALATAGWTYLANGANAQPDAKNRTFAHTPYMYSHGERGGPMATYLVTAKARSNFNLWMNTTVERLVRTGGHITGIQVTAYGDNGYTGIVNLTAITGRVILSAGTFGSSKILMRSGIGPNDTLTVVKSSTDGPTMISSRDWINVPVGYNLNDHLDTDMVITHPNVTFYDFYKAYDTPIAADSSLYLTKRSGIFTQAAPNIGPMFWESIYGKDGIVRQLQWTARVEGSLGDSGIHSMTLSQYLGTGATSRGRLTITQGLTMTVSTHPYLHNQYDIDAVVTGIAHMQTILSKVPGLVMLNPKPGQTAADYVANYVVSPAARRSNHWIGTAKLGTDDGRNGGTAVVDTNTKVYGTDNLFVVDASIFPGHVTTNPSAFIITAAERASELILKLPVTTAQARYGQCAGSTWNGPFICAAPYTCVYKDAFYSQCL